LNVPNRGRRGLLGANAAEKAEVARRVAAIRASKVRASESAKPAPVELRPMRYWPATGHYTKARG
jgi:hypothetical protein